MKCKCEVYVQQCDHCGKLFDIRKGEGWGRSYFKAGAMLPSTLYECNDCMNKEHLELEIVRLKERLRKNDGD